MKHLNEIHEGNWVSVPNEGEQVFGEVDKIGMEKAGVDIGSEIIWYAPQDIQPIPLTEDWLFKFGFEKSDDPSVNGDGQVYTHGPFIFTYPEKDNTQVIHLRCHGAGDRQFTHGLAVHELQHHYHEMTKVYVE